MRAELPPHARSVRAARVLVRDALHAWDVTTEAARVLGNDIVLFLGAGVQAAKLTNTRIERLTGGVGTARSMTVVRALAVKWGE